MDVWEAARFIEKKLEEFNQDDIMPLELAQRFIANSVYWYRHRHGPVKAPKYAERITLGDHGWEVEFGANSFLVEQAIRGCNDQTLKVISVVSYTNEKWPFVDLRERLDTSIRRAVSNYRGERYLSLWQVTNGHMLFGTQSIHISDFIYSYGQFASLWLITE